MTPLNPYLFFDGNCAEAMRFYEGALNAKIEMMLTHGETPMADQGPPEHADRIVHARLVRGDWVLMASDDMADRPYRPMQGFRLSLACASAEETCRQFDALAAGGNVEMPVQKTFWSEAFGMLTDRYGTPWMVTVAG